MSWGFIGKCTPSSFPTIPVREYHGSLTARLPTLASSQTVHSHPRSLRLLAALLLMMPCPVGDTHAIRVQRWATCERASRTHSQGCGYPLANSTNASRIYVWRVKMQTHSPVWRDFFPSHWPFLYVWPVVFWLSEWKHWTWKTYPHPCHSFMLLAQVACKSTKCNLKLIIRGQLQEVQINFLEIIHRECDIFDSWSTGVSILSRDWLKHT
jgi:hypothetical protein